MSYELGRAEFIIDVNNEDALRDMARFYNEQTNKARKAAEEIAKADRVRESSVRQAASVLISQEKKLAAEQDKIRKAQAAANKKYIIDSIKNEVAELKKAERAQQEYIRTIQRLDKERDAAAKRQLARIQQEIAAENRARAEAERAATRADRSSRTRGGTGSPALSGVVRGLPGDLATIAGFGAIASGALIVREALVKVTEATLNQQQAQRSLNAAFGETQALYKQNADNLAQQFGLVSSTVEQATARFGVLAKQTNLTGEQIRELNKVAIDNQAAFGGDLIEAHRALAGAILGETEAYEKYGVVLQEGVLKNSNKLTEDERRRFTTMSEGEKQMIRYRIIMEEANKTTGAAAVKAKEAAGGFDALNRSIDELAKTIGSTFVNSAGNFAKAFSKVLADVDKQIKIFQQIQQAMREIKQEQGAGPISLIGSVLDPRVAIRVERNAALQREFEREKQQRAQQAEARENEEKAQIEARQKEEAAIKLQIERTKEMLDRAHKEEIRRIDEQKKLAEIRQRNELAAIDKQKDAELQALEEVEDARRRAAELNIAQRQADRDEELRIIDEKKTAELDRLEVEQEARRAAAADAIDNLQVEKEARIRANEDTKRSELERLETQKEERDRLREIENRQIADDIKRRERLLEDNHRRALRRLEREAESLRDKHNKEIKQIEDREEREDERHRRRMRQIDDEAERQLDGIDAELRKLDELQRVRDAQRRRNQLGQQLSEAQLRLREAQGTQDPFARAAAQQKLVAAIRLGDPEAIRRAQAELTEIVGQGTKAVAEAQRELSNIQQELRDNDLDNAEEAQRRKLQDEQKRIRDTQEAERRQEEDRNRRRKKRLDDDKEADKQRLDSALRGIERRREREEDASRKAKRELDDLVEYNARRLADRRQEEDQFYEDSVEAAQERYTTEQRAIEDTYDNEKTGLIPAIRRSLAATETAYQNARTEVEKRYKAERDAVEETYNHPVNGVLAILRRQEEDARTEYGKVVEVVREKYAAMAEIVRKTYRADDGKSGILDQLDNQKEQAQIELDKVKAKFEDHAKGLVGEQGVITLQWKQAIVEANKYYDHIIRRQQELEERDRQRRNNPPDTRIPVGPGRFVPELPEGQSGGGSAVPPLQNAPAEPVSLSEFDPKVYVPWVRGATSGYWTDQGTHHVPGATDNMGASDVFAPIGTPIYAAVAGRVRSLSDPSGGNAAILSGDNGYYYYLAHGNVRFTSGTVRMGQQIGEVGDTGSAAGAPHLHWAIANDPSVFDRLRGKGNIRGDSTYWTTRDNGYMFNNPTYYQDLRTGEKGVLAERRPELLLGGKATQQVMSMGLTRSLSRPSTVANDYMRLGTGLAASSTVVETTAIGGDSLVYNGVAPENLMKQWREDQRTRNLLRGYRRAR